MKKIKICILSCLSVFILTSCELNIVPDNIPTIEDHAFALRKEAEKVLFTCYRYMPSDGSLKNNVALLGAGDFCISDVFRSYLGNMRLVYSPRIAKVRFTILCSMGTFI